MSNRESRPKVFTTPLEGGKPIGVPITLDAAFGEAVEQTSEQFPEIIDLRDIVQPAKNSKA